jgi:tRNA(adenine34) deaminase
MSDDDFMCVALEQARKAARRGEVPVGAVIVRNGRVIAKCHNQRERKKNALAHAEVLAINKACRRLRSWRLDDCVMYVTLQPCLMCAGAILNARIKTVVMGTLASEKMCVDSLEIYQKNNLNWKTEVIVAQDKQCSDILKEFFGARRR